MVSKHQLLGGPDLQTFHGRWLGLSGFWIADMEQVAQKHIATAPSLPVA